MNQNICSNLQTIEIGIKNLETILFKLTLASVPLERMIRIFKKPYGNPILFLNFEIWALIV